MLGSGGNPQEIIFSIIALLLAIDFHEFCHAWAAEHLGDPTARLMGRLTLNPLAHLDPIGTILLVLVGFGWGKPVPFDPYNLRNPRRDGALISFAGPISNILFATVSAILFRTLPASVIMAGDPLSLGRFLVILTFMNIMLAVFNFVPIHPLDGFKIVEGFLPEQQAAEWHELERYGMIFLIILLLPIFSGGALISQIITPPINFIFRILLPGAPLL